MFFSTSKLAVCHGAPPPWLQASTFLPSGSRGQLGCLRVAGRRAVLAVQATHVAFHHRAGPDFLAGICVAGEQVADDAEFVTRGTMHQQHFAALLVLDDEGRASHRVADLVVAPFLRPDHLAGVLVEGHDAGVQGAEEDLVAVDGGAAVHHVAAGTDVVRQASFVFPQALAGSGFDRINAGVGGWSRR
jgi:hypothetical protein